LDLEPADHVDWVIATHAHDDHIAGFAEVVEACANARVVLPEASSAEEFFALTRIDSKLEFYDTRWRIYREFERALSEIEMTGRLQGSLHFGSAGKTFPIGGGAPGEPSLEFIAPSDYAVLLARRAIGHLLKAALKPGAPEQVARRDPNTFSAALILRCLGASILLTGDVRNGHPGWGWTHVIASFGAAGDIDVMKVAHHGDPNAHEPIIWHDWLRDDATALVAPYRPAGRPRPEDIERMCSAGRAVWTTCRSGSIAPSKDVRKTTAKLRGVAVHPKEVGGRVGQVRYRRRAGAEPTLESFGPSIRLC
jgi:hypothetical protein